MAKTFRPHEPDQIYIFPPSLRESLPDYHLIIFLGDVVDTLDLCNLQYVHGGAWTSADHPLLMVPALRLCPQDL